MNLKEHQINLTKIAKDFHNYCESNGFKYYMGFGTFLGAVRHRGFIPWDDDLDFIMWRDEYNKFINDVKNNPNNPFEINNDKFKNLPVISLRYKGLKKDNYTLFDLFPIDFIPEKRTVKIIKKSKILVEVFFIKNSSFFALFKRKNKKENNPLILCISILKRIAIKLLYPYKIVNSNFQKQIESFERSELCFDGLNFSQTIRQPRKSLLFHERTLYQFESIKLYGVKDYDSYLKGSYNDYMKIPENKISHKTWDL